MRNCVSCVICTVINILGNQVLLQRTGADLIIHVVTVRRGIERNKLLRGKLKQDHCRYLGYCSGRERGQGSSRIPLNPGPAVKVGLFLEYQ